MFCAGKDLAGSAADWATLCSKVSFVTTGRRDPGFLLICGDELLQKDAKPFLSVHPLCVCCSPLLSSCLALFFPIKQTNKKNHECCLTGGEWANTLVIVTCFLFVVPSRTAARFCTQLAPLPYQNNLLQKRKILANLFFKKQTNKTNSPSHPNPLLIFLGLVCASAWYVPSPSKRSLAQAGMEAGAASVYQCQRVSPGIPRGFEAVYIVDLRTKLPWKGCYQSQWHRNLRKQKFKLPYPQVTSPWG